MKSKTITLNKLDMDNLKRLIVEEYIIKSKSYIQMCELLNISKGSFQSLLDKLDIPARKAGGNRHKKYVFKKLQI